MKYTLVRHTGWTIGFNPQFQQAVELTGVGSDIMEKQIQKAGGFLADSYEQASHAEYVVNYPPSVVGLIPHARGTFTAINRNEVYVLTADDVVDIANTSSPAPGIK